MPRETAAGVVIDAVGPRRADLAWVQDAAFFVEDRGTGEVADHHGVFADVDFMERVLGRVLRAALDDLVVADEGLAAVVRDFVADGPVLHAFERVIGGEDAFAAECDEAIGACVDESATGMTAERAAGAVEFGVEIFGECPGLAVVGRDETFAGVDGVAAGHGGDLAEHVESGGARVSGDGPGECLGAGGCDDALGVEFHG